MKLSTSCALLFILTTSLAGCSTDKWVVLKNGQTVSETEMNMDGLKCEREAAATYPYVPVSVSIADGSSSESNTVCAPWGNTIRCTTSGGRTSAPLVLTRDANSDKREQFQKSCMTALGYRRVTVQPDTGDAHPAATTSYTLRPVRACESNTDCEQGKSCRSTIGGGTECRKASAEIMACRSNADCAEGRSCRSSKGGGTECR